MPIEVTSLPRQARIRNLRGIVRQVMARALHPLAYSFRNAAPLSKRQLLLRSVPGLMAIALVAGGDSLLRSYKYYSRIIDARLASGYLTSRPGLYAAPRTIQVGQNTTRARLIDALRRAGYAESANGSAYPTPVTNNLWSGSFSQTDAAIEIRPARRGNRPAVIRATVGDVAGHSTITELTGDDLPLDSLTLEPEVLSNDLSYKTGKRETVRYSDLPPVLVQAILAIEDRRFFHHSGLDPLGIGRALLRNAGEERVGQGGSTITQQLVKNTYLTPERTMRRKYAEAMLAFALERRLTKQDIFALYCNEVYLGQRGAVAARGVREAAQMYFKKELKDLSLSEAATLAGMIQGPVRYSPVRYPEAAQERRNLVLKSMVRDGWIDAAQSAELLPEPVVVSPASVSNNSLAPHFVDYVNRMMETAGDTVGESRSEWTDGSVASRRVYTTIDLDLQRLAETAIKKQLDRLDVTYKNGKAKPQAALVALDPRTGNVVAMVGGRDYARSQLNRATDARRQPGSTFKPFVYAAALEDGMSPVQQFADAPRDFVYDRNKIYRPANFGGGYSMREVTMRQALVQSLNTVTVDVAMQTGLARIANLAAEFGLPRPERYPSLALGTEEVTPLQLAAAYAAFVNGGRKVQPRVIAAVGSPPAAEPVDNDANQVVSPTTAYMVTNMLSAAVDHGTARSARGAVKGTAIAGKTGTSRDGWFVGYTQNLVCVVWIGFDDNQQLGLTGAAAALPAWTDFMSAAVELRPELGGRNFECPEGINFVEIDADSGLRSTLTCPHRELIAVTNRLAPNLECFEHGSFPEMEALAPEHPREGENQTVLAQHAPAPLRLVRPRDSHEVAATRIDVDAHGKRTLVSDMP